jgi:hypothetical protein
MNFILRLSVDTDAFTPTPYPETARILREIADRLDGVVTAPPRHARHPSDALGDYGDRQGGWTGHYQTAFDRDGQDVGRYAFKADDDL